MGRFKYSDQVDQEFGGNIIYDQKLNRIYHFKGDGEGVTYEIRRGRAVKISDDIGLWITLRMMFAALMGGPRK